MKKSFRILKFKKDKPIFEAKDIRGEIFADNLFFDLKNQTVDIKSSSKNNVKANIKVNEKKF